MSKIEIMKKVEELKKQGKNPHGDLRDLLIDLQIAELEKRG